MGSLNIKPETLLEDFGRVTTEGGLPFVKFTPRGPGTSGHTFVIAATNLSGSFRVSLFDEGRMHRNFSVDVTGPREDLLDEGKVKPATVNWPGIGARSFDEALLFAKVLEYAARVAMAATENYYWAKKQEKEAVTK